MKYKAESDLSQVNNHGNIKQPAVIDAAVQASLMPGTRSK
jgi:hypothetical protein